MILRNYTEQDLNSLLSLWWDSWHSSASFDHPYPLEVWKSRWENLLLTHQVAVLETQETIIGFAAVNPQTKELSQIFVSPGRKGEGHGKTLFEWARSICGDSMMLKTLVDNSEARAFYRSRGMREVGYSVNDFNGKEEIVYSFNKAGENPEEL